MKKFGLSKKERLKKKKEFEAVYTKGRFIISDNGKFKANYLIFENQKQPIVKVAFAVSRKAGNAVWRNRVKRLMRESYRLNKLSLLERVKEKNLRLFLIFSPVGLNKNNSKKIFLRDVQPQIVTLLEKIKDTIQ